MFHKLLYLYESVQNCDKTQQPRHFAEDSNGQVKPQPPSYTAGFAAYITLGGYADCPDLEHMKTQIILLRGVTPAGKNKVLMAPLRAVLEDAGLANVRTYIQSGNVIASTDLTQAAIEKLVHDVISDKFGGDIVVLARPVSHFKKALAGIPFKKPDTSKLYFTLLASKPKPSLLKDFIAPGYAPDKIEVTGDLAYVLCATKYSDLKINNNFIERKLEVSATTRVYDTIAKLVELSEQ